MSRDQVFANIRRGLKRGEADQQTREQALARITAKKPNLIPARAQLPRAQQIELFREMATTAAAEIIDIDDLDTLPVAVNTWLKHHKIDHLVRSTVAEFEAMDWSKAENLSIETRVAQAGDQVSLTDCFSAIAETGTLMLHSKAESPTTLNFLPDIHLVLLRSSQVVGVYEEAWSKLRESRGDNWPRSVNMITGPSRSTDIGQTLYMGAHGPCVLVIFMLNDL